MYILTLQRFTNDSGKLSTIELCEKKNRVTIHLDSF